MALAIKVVYENGAFRPVEPVDLPEGQEAVVVIQHEFISALDDDLDILTSASFAEKLTTSDIINVIQIILEVARSKAAEGVFFVGFVTMEVNLEKVKLQFRFSNRKEEISKLDAPDRDELPRKISRFTWHLFAKIDSSYKLGDTTLPSGFRSYISLDE